ncbi:MAG: 2-C-methyl-D-erythritol 4-phosphate cytidylyltransferase [Lachnospiraceae bacterium]|nr:2-C-methyl-D-erythritol 4-phosphate cytidylyltransferase [Lachnospiraceae bacterium]
MRHIAIVLAAGRGKRMNSNVAKQYLLLRDKPVLYYALNQFEHSFIDDIILVTGAEDIAYCAEEIVAKYGFTKVRQVVAGGRERYHSVHQGLVAAGKLLQDEALAGTLRSAVQEADNEVALTQAAPEVCIYIHDGARPFISEEILLRARKSVERYGSGVVGMPVKDTIKIADESGFAADTPKRSLVWQVQTPQCFLYSEIAPAYTKLIETEEALLAQGIAITDDAMVMELLGNRPVKLVEGSYENIKITTPEDLAVAESFFSK